MRNSIEFKKILFLLYLNTYKDFYLLSELKVFLGFNNTQLNKFIDFMKENNLLLRGENLIISNEGILLLKSKGLYNIKLSDLDEEFCTLNIVSKENISNRLYIP